MALVTVPTIFKSVRRIKEPYTEPVTLFEAKEHLRLMPDFADDDDYINGLIAAARRLTEDRVNRTWTLTRWQATFCNWMNCGCHGQELPRPPLFVSNPFDKKGSKPSLEGEKVEITYVDGDGNEQNVADENIQADVYNEPGRVHLHETIASSCCQSNGVIRWWAGVENPADVPPQAKAAIKLLVAHWYMSREAVTVNTSTAELPMAVDSLLASLSWSGGY